MKLARLIPSQDLDWPTSENNQSIMAVSVIKEPNSDVVAAANSFLKFEYLSDLIEIIKYLNLL